MKKRPHPKSSMDRNRTMAARAGRNMLTVADPKANRRKVRTGKLKMTRKRKIQIAAAVVGCFIFVCAVAVYLVWRSLTGHIHVVTPEQESMPSEFDVPTESLVIPVPVKKGIINILLLGVDAREVNSVKERSDSMMILTIDEINGKIKLTSLQRDMLVYIPGRAAPDKINAANALGGPVLAMRVVNETLRLSISDYMVVNMRGMEQLIDIAGGIMINVTQSEISYLNASVGEENALYPDSVQSDPVTKSGLQLLNGRQSVAYARIRKLDSDYKRMERQRTVLQTLFSTFMNANLITKTNMITDGLGLITTNVSATRMTELGLKILPMMDTNIEQLQIPINGYFTEYSGETWVNLCDFNGMIPSLQQFIFGTTYTFDPVKEIPGAPNSSSPKATTKATTKPAATAAPTAAPTNPPTTQTQAPTTAKTTAPTTTGTKATTSATSATAQPTATPNPATTPTPAAATSPATTK